MSGTSHAPAVTDYLCGGLARGFDLGHCRFKKKNTDRRRLETAHHA